MAEIDPILAPLNDVQRDIVTACDGPMLVLAGAGSGKTRAVTHKMAWLLKKEQYLPYRILAVTFTNKAAGEMRERIRQLVGPPADGLELGTFHSVSARLLRRHADRLGHTSSFVIYDTDDATVLMRQIIKDWNYDPKKFAPKRLVSTWDSLRSHSRNLDRWQEEGGWQESWREGAADLFREYEKRKARLDAMDFSDLLFKFYRLLADHDDVRQTYQERFQYVLVDEMQDTNHIQLEMLKLLVGDHRRICAVGDDDQSIYGWRGARVENMLDFERSFPGARVVRMVQNYRSTRMILKAAHSVIAHNRRRHDKELWTEGAEGDRVTVMQVDSEGDEAVQVARHIQRLMRQGLSARDAAVFFRTNAQSRSFEEIFSREQIPHIVVGGMRFYERAEVKDALAYLRVIANPRDEISLLRIMNKPPRGIGDGALQKLRDRAYDDGLSLYEAGLAIARGERSERWHKAVGRFFDLTEKWRREADGLSISDLAMLILEESTYLAKLQGLDSIEAESRLENLQELVGGIAGQEEKDPELTLQGYLEQIALITDIDSWSADREHVPLMTVHAAKGLEFNTVFITGMEEGLFPHQSHSDEDELEEERRLFYVAITRAREQVFVSHAKSRMRFGTWEYMKPSPFLGELDPDCVDSAVPRRRGSFADASRRAVPNRRREGVTVRRSPAASSTGRRVKHGTFGAGKVLATVGPNVVVKFDDGRLITVKQEAVTEIP